MLRLQRLGPLTLKSLRDAIAMVLQIKSEDEPHEMMYRDATSSQDYPDGYAHNYNEDGVETHLLPNEQAAYPSESSPWVRVLTCGSHRRNRHRSAAGWRPRSALRHSLRRLCLTCASLTFAIVVVTAVLFPSYTNPPARYRELRSRVESSRTPGAGNPDKQKVFIAASIFDQDGLLAGGKWAECVLDLIQVLGPENVYLSIYENDAGEKTAAALNKLKQKVPCEHTLRFDEHLGLNEVQHVILPDGSDRVKRITYLAEARNRALLPLHLAPVRYDKLLYLNDVVFDPIEAAQLLFLTGAGGELGQKAVYRAACAVDFINPIKYYDTFATRDIEGYGVGLPFFPWFTTAGHGTSRREALAGSDAIQVRSCWGGMVAFDARFFQVHGTDTPTTAGSGSPANLTAPYHFRAESDMYWDASECCLIHADIQDPDPSRSGIYMNPYVRTAYDWNTLTWLRWTRRFERLYTPLHWILTKLVGMPWYNPRRNEQPWTEVDETIWVDSSFRQVTRVASHSGYCGRRGLQLMKTDRSKGGKPWESAPIPG